MPLRGRSAQDTGRQTESVAQTDHVGIIDQIQDRMLERFPFRLVGKERGQKLVQLIVGAPVCGVQVRIQRSAGQPVLIEQLKEVVHKITSSH